MMGFGHGDFKDLLLYLGAQTPLYLVLIVGIVMAVAYWRRCPTASLFAIFGLTLYLLTSVVNAMFTFLAPDFIFDMFGDEMAFFFTDILFALLRGVAFVLIFIAIFNGRAHVGMLRGQPEERRR